MAHEFPSRTALARLCRGAAAFGLLAAQWLGQAALAQPSGGPYGPQRSPQKFSP